MTSDNKLLVQNAMADLFGAAGVDALEALLAGDFVHHRPDSTSTGAEWLASVREALSHLGEMQLQVHHLLSDGDFVVIHSRRWLPDGGPEIAVVDVLRFSNGVIAEAWEVTEPVSEAAFHLRWWENP